MPKSAALKIARQVGLAVAAFGALQWLAWQLPPPWSFAVAAGLLVAVLAATAFVLDMVVPGLGLLSRAISRLDRPNGDYVVLTFDDGPIEPFTSRVLDALDAGGAKATFFCIGENVRRHPTVARDIAARGHDVGNHADTHALLPLQGTSTIRAEITRAADAIEEATGVRPHWLRCPKGYKSRRVQRVARDLGHELIGFSYPVYDVENPPPEELAARVLDRARPGDILLLHDGHAPHKPRRCDSVVEALPAILDGLRERGLEPVSLSQAIQRQPELARLQAAASPRLDKAPA